MLNMGLRVGAGTDAPRVSSYNPWLSLSWLVTGRTVGGVQLYPPENRVSREAALDMYTTAGADFSAESAVKGTISVGKYGDLAILSADYFCVPEEDISRIESLCTVVGGRVVYSAGEFEGITPPLPAIPYDWSPVDHFGGYQQQLPRGVRQAEGVAEVAAASAEQRRMARGARGEARLSPTSWTQTTSAASEILYSPRANSLRFWARPEPSTTKRLGYAL